eukprot:s593_g7.t1
MSYSAALGHVPVRPVEASETYQRAVCGYFAPSFRILRVHLPTAHGQKASHRFDAQRFRVSCTQSMACRLAGCAGVSFRWTSLRAHINAGRGVRVWTLQREAQPVREANQLVIKQESLWIVSICRRGNSRALEPTWARAHGRSIEVTCQEQQAATWHGTQNGPERGPHLKSLLLGGEILSLLSARCP